MSPSPPPPLVYVIMGVSGCGKSTVGALLAGRLGCPFYEGDDYHCAASVAKMWAGSALTDDDRWPWLARLAALIQGHRAAATPAVLSCSALTPAYRHLLCTGQRLGGPPPPPQQQQDDSADQAGDAAVAFVLLDPPREVLEQRLRQRVGHFASPALLDSQLRTLEWRDDELLLRVGGGSGGDGGGGGAFPSAEAAVDAVMALRQGQDGGGGGGMLRSVRCGDGDGGGCASDS